MKYILLILITVSICTTTAARAATDPVPFEKFFKKTMKVTPGLFPVYQDGTKYYLEIPATGLNSDLLVIGDISRGYANNVASSSGVIRLSMGNGNNLNVTKQVYKEGLSPDFNRGMESLVQSANLIPVSFVLPIEAMGKDKKSYIIDISKQLLEGGDLFTFKDFSGLSHSDAARSGVQQVKASQDGVVFSVLRTQTEPGSTAGGGKAVDHADAYVLNLIIQHLSSSHMKVREADPRIGFTTVGYNDFGKSPYGVHAVKVINKWKLEVRAADRQRYAAGELVNPAKPVKVFIDQITPSIFVPYVKQAVEQWNAAFSAAGFKNVLVIATDENENWLSSGKILIKWGNAFKDVSTNVVADPRTGEILAAKMNITEDIADQLMPSYFAKCGLKDPRILKDFNNPEVRGEIMRWKVAQAMGSLLGMEPNLYGSAAYTTDELRSPGFLKKNSFSSSVTDDTEFNYAVQPGDNVAVADLMPAVSHYDKMAISWAYRIFPDHLAEQKAMESLKYATTSLRYVKESKTDPFTQHGDLASDQLEASALGMKNLALLYPQLEEISGKMKGNDDDWSDFKTIAKGFQVSYQLYVNNVSNYIGGQSLRPVIRNYNDIPVVYISKKDQHQAFELLNDWLFSGTPIWMQNKRMNLLSNESEDVKMERSAQDMLKKFMTPAVVNNLLDAEYALGADTYTVKDLFNDFDHLLFYDFDPHHPVSKYKLTIQSNFIVDLAAVANKEIKQTDAGNLSEFGSVIHQYYNKMIAHIAQLSETHDDTLVKEQYQMIKAKLDRDNLVKTN